MQNVKAKKNLDDYDKKFFTFLPACYAIVFAYDSDNVVKLHCPFQHLTNSGMRRMDYKIFLKELNAKISYATQMGYDHILLMLTQIHGGGRVY